jgi:sarcosine oxidase delta subunit
LWTSINKINQSITSINQSINPIYIAKLMVATNITEDLVPDWLRGTWTRDYIRRAVGGDDDNNSRVLGPPDSSVHVRYIQTPWAFVDVRRAPGTMQGAMAFAGITTVVLGNNNNNNDSPPLVRWHACLDMTEPFEDASDRWSQADKGVPRPTMDEGHFTRLSENVYQETDPAGSLEEQWVRSHDGSNKFLAARRGTALLVVAGETFGFATQTTEDMPATFVAGHITGEQQQQQQWVIEMSAADPTLEGSFLVLPGTQSEWTILRGSTLHFRDLKPNFQT